MVHGVSSEPVTIPDERSVIVVSDLHFGLDNQENVGRYFSDFLRYVQTLKPKGAYGRGRPVIVNGKEKELYAPAKLILLGDIVDFESPRKNTRASVLADCAPLFTALAGLDPMTEIVYVTGNHDDEISDWAGTYPGALPHTLTIVRRHYPDTGYTRKGQRKLTGMPIGGQHRYHFMHGQQFDILFNTAGILQDYPSWVGKNYQLFRENQWLAWFFRALLIVTLILPVAPVARDMLRPPWDTIAHVVLGISLVVVLFSIEPLMLRKFWDRISRKKMTKANTIETIIEQGFWLPDAGKNLLADTIVFGHTHIADDSKDRYLADYGKRFINSGAWEERKRRARNKAGESETNTFVYIDTEGPLLCYWPVNEPGPDEGRRPVHIPVTLTGDKKGEVEKVSPLILWIRRNLFVKG